MSSTQQATCDREALAVLQAIPPAGERAIAVLDDDASLSRTICLVLRACGLGASSFSSVAAFEEAVRLTRYDAFVLDWDLAGVTADTVIARLRLSLYPTTPIFLHTGQLVVDGTPAEAAVALTLARYQVRLRQKPYSLRRLAAEIQMALQVPRAWLGGDRQADRES